MLARYTTRMSYVPLFSGRRRLLALCVVSLLLHVAVLAWIGQRAPRRPPAGGDAGALVLQVHVAAAPVSGDSGRTPVLKTDPPRAEPAPDADEISSKQGPVADAADAAASADAAAPAPGSSPALPHEALFGAPQASLDSAQTRFRVLMPPSMQLDYTVVQSAPGAPPQPAAGARLTWRSTDGGYRVQLDGAPAADGRRTLASSGILIDLGMAPLDADTGAPRAAQDEASMLMLLASMGMKDPGQLENDVRILVDSDGVLAVLRFKPVGTERVASALGPLDTVHLAQVSGPGAARLEVWLAPARNWMPVQLRDTWADGSVTTRLVERMTAPAD